MKKGYYIHFEGRSSVGVSKKIDMQMEEFRKNFEMQELEVKSVSRSIVQRIWGLFPTMSIMRNYQEVLEQITNPDFIYVRRTVADREYLNFFETIRKRYSECKIIIEIFTYPYDKDDFGKWNAWPFYIKELLYRRRLKKYVDRFVTYSDDDNIFGVPTIITTNGIIVDDVREVRGEFSDNEINMIAVAYMQRHHGYERILEGLRNYYLKGSVQPTVNLLMIGDGPEKPKYTELVKKYHLEEYVSFHDEAIGETLDNLYDKSDIALASFGMYKIGYFGQLGALKTRECLAKGIPIITGCEIEGVGSNLEFIKCFANDKSMVDIDEVVKFYLKLKQGFKDKRELSSMIRSFAEEHVSMERVLRPIVDYVEGDC